MVATYKRTITVTITPKSGTPTDETGTATPITVTGDAAHGAYMAFKRGDRRYELIQEDGTRTIVNMEECICAMSEEFGEGDEYVKPDCEDLFCPAVEEPVEP
ncbi:MAG: hypothetical protein ACK5LJ_08145 [Paracoccus sp. (in: a-proteobacteria)]